MAAPILIVVCQVALVALQSLPARGFVGVAGLLTNLPRPLAIGRLQQEADHNVRAPLRYSKGWHYGSPKEAQ